DERFSRNFRSWLGARRGASSRALVDFGYCAAQVRRRNGIERKGRAHESCRRGTVGAAADVFRPLAVHAVLERPLGRQNSHDWAIGLFSLGVGDRDRQDRALYPYTPRNGPFRAGILVRPVAGRALSSVIVASGTLDGGIVRGRNA